MKFHPSLFVLFLQAISVDAADPEFEAMLDDLLDGSVPQISPASLAEKIESKRDPILLLDSRTEEEYETSHIDGARWVGFREFNVKDLEKVDRDTPVVVYCSVGKRSEIVGEKLKKAGFQNVVNLRGGLFQWANENRPLTDAHGSTKNVHPYDRKWGKWLAPHVPQKS